MIENPLIPMAAITGKPSKAFLTETLERFRKAGVTQYLIYPRSGCELEYLSDEWFEVCCHIVEECKRLGFTSVWLYDEFNWPSGKCNGKVMEGHPEYCSTELCFTRENGVTVRTIRHNPDKGNVLSPEAAQRFITLTHEVYAEKMGKYFGNIIKGFFTDEPYCGFNRRVPAANEARIPYYDGIEEDYRRITGRELVYDVERAWDGEANVYEPVCRKLQEKRFTESFILPVANWCKEHDLLLTGHLMDEAAASKALFQSGHPLTVLSLFGVPGIDLIRTGETLGEVEPLTLATGMYAIDHSGNRGGLAELFALGPCDLTPERLRRQLWLVALFGIDHYVLAVSALDARGNIPKPMYYNPCSPTQGWFELYAELGEEAAAAARVARKEREYTIGVRYNYHRTFLEDFLLELYQNQFNVTLLMPGEESSCPYIVNITQDGRFIEERSGRIYASFELLIADFCLKKDARKICFYEKSGAVARDLFVRTFRDNSAVAIDFGNCRRELFFERNGKRTPCVIHEKGVLTIPGYKVECSAPNTSRVFFTEGKFVFTLKAEIPGLKLAVRNFESIPRLLLDGKPVAAVEPCTVLPQGFNEIFLQTEDLALAAGEHVIEAVSGCDDYPFMPPAFLAGCFEQEDEVIFAPGNMEYRSTAGVNGKIIQSAEVDIPVEAWGLEIDTGKLGTEVKINGISLGKRLWEPFFWRLPAGVAGARQKIEIIRWTSCGDVFATDHIPGRLAIPMTDLPAPSAVCEIVWK